MATNLSSSAGRDRASIESSALVQFHKRINRVAQRIGLRNPFFLLRQLVVYSVDLSTYMKFRQPGLLKFQLLFLHPQEIKWGYGSKRPATHLGVIRSGDNPVERVPVLEAQARTVAIVIERIRSGSWELAGEFTRLMDERKRKGKSHSPEDKDFLRYVDLRYKVLDELITEVSITRRLRTRSEIESRAFRERGGVAIEIDACGEVSLRDGHHRFGIALGLGLTRIPVALVAVDRKFVESGGWRIFLASHRSET